MEKIRIKFAQIALIGYIFTANMAAANQYDPNCPKETISKSLSPLYTEIYVRQFKYEPPSFRGNSLSKINTKLTIKNIEKSEKPLLSCNTNISPPDLPYSSFLYGDTICYNNYTKFEYNPRTYSGNVIKIEKRNDLYNIKGGSSSVISGSDCTETDRSGVLQDKNGTFVCIDGLTSLFRDDISLATAKGENRLFIHSEYILDNTGKWTGGISVYKMHTIMEYGETKTVAFTKTTQYGFSCNHKEAPGLNF